MEPAWIDARGIESKGRDCLASMGIYVFNRKLLVDMLSSTDYADFGKEVFPEAIKTHHVQTHLYDGYWEDIGTIKSFYDANLSLANNEPSFELFTPDAPIYTRARYLPPTKAAGARIDNSLVANGCVIGEGAVIENSILGLRSIVGRNVTIKNSIVMGSDFYQTDCGHQRLKSVDALPIGIGDNSVIDGAIIDKNCRIGSDVRIVNDLGIEDSRQDHPVCVIRDGIPVFVKSSRIEDGSTLESILQLEPNKA